MGSEKLWRAQGQIGKLKNDALTALHEKRKAAVMHGEEHPMSWQSFAAAYRKVVEEVVGRKKRSSVPPISDERKREAEAYRVQLRASWDAVRMATTVQQRK